MQRVRIITRNVWVLSFVSLFNDVGSEMLYPVMPVYLKSIGFSIVLIGVLEGIAEAVAGLSKGYFGNRSDNIGKRLPFIQFGYGLSVISKSMLAAFAYPVWIFFARTADKLGKGIRTGARDALLSDEATPQTKGRVFGFHRTMDTFGAVLGPLLALVYLYYNPNNYRALFLIAIAPSVMTLGLTFFIKEKKHTEVLAKRKTRLFDFIKYWKGSPPLYKQLVRGLLLFALFNSSDVFLLLKIREAGYNDTVVIGTYVFYNLIYALFSYPFGAMSDRLGKKTVFIIGLIAFAGVYAGMGFSENKWVFFGLFFLYGLFAAATEGIAKAWITNVCDKKYTATAIGTYTSYQSIASLIASSLAGVLWFAIGSLALFLSTAIVTLVVAIYLSRIKSGANV